MRFPDRARAALVSSAAAAEPLAVFRIGVALVALLQAFVLWRHREMLLGEFGLVPWIIVDHLTDPWTPKLSSIAALLAPLHVGADAVVVSVLAVHAIAATMLLAGFATRIAAIVAWATYLPINNTGILFSYGLGALVLIALFYCMFMPVGRAWSLDARARPAPAGGDDSVTMSVVVLRIHLCIVYAAAGLSKAVGAQWWTGDAIWRALSLPQFQQFDPAPLAGFAGALQAAAIGAVLLQLAYPVLVWTRLRAAVVLFVELLHFGIALFLGLWLFSAMMMVFNAGAFGEAMWRVLRRKL